MQVRGEPAESRLLCAVALPRVISSPRNPSQSSMMLAESLHLGQFIEAVWARRMAFRQSCLPEGPHPDQGAFEQLARQRNRRPGAHPASRRRRGQSAPERCRFHTARASGSRHRLAPSTSSGSIRRVPCTRRFGPPAAAGAAHANSAARNRSGQLPQSKAGASRLRPIALFLRQL
jgi:hypothetical protein